LNCAPDDAPDEVSRIDRRRQRLLGAEQLGHSGRGLRVLVERGVGGARTFDVLDADRLVVDGSGASIEAQVRDPVDRWPVAGAGGAPRRLQRV
jgi:hypothetical protein